MGQKLYHKLGNFLLPIGASVITNWGNFVLLPIGVASFYYKLGQVLLQIGADFFLLQIGTSVITNWSSLTITNQGKFFYKSG